MKSNDIENNELFAARCARQNLVNPQHKHWHFADSPMAYSSIDKPDQDEIDEANINNTKFREGKL